MLLNRAQILHVSVGFLCTAMLIRYVNNLFKRRRFNNISDARYIKFVETGCKQAKLAHDLRLELK